MRMPLYIVDAFADRPFTGNNAAVCFLTEPAPTEWMQQVAAEMKLAETCFIRPERDGFELRWFTPVLEVDLCGHATLAAAHVMWESDRLAADELARFHTRSGLLTVERGADGITMDFPAWDPEPFPEGRDVAVLLGARPVSTWRHGMQGLVEVEDEQMVRSLSPDFARLMKYPLRGVIVTARSDDPAYDFVSRYFAPRVGVPEDPVTGSAHCCLAPFWGERLKKKDMVGYQASARGGVVRVGLRGDRVCLTGRAVTVVRGEWCAPTTSPTRSEASGALVNA
jgi:PhzF family phenazine biosynthesis protein